MLKHIGYGRLFLWKKKNKKKTLISHRQTKAFTVHTSTALLKVDTSPKPSAPCYYCDISNLSLPMTGLMIMFPVLFQPQITANSVIRGLLCQPSSGPLTVCWPEAVFLQLWYAWTFWLSSGTNGLRKSMEHYICQSWLSSNWCGRCESTVPRLITSFKYLFLSQLSLIEVLSKQVIMTIFNLHCRSSDTWTESYCFDLILFHSFTWVERIFPHVDCFVQCLLSVWQPAWWSKLATRCVSSCEHDLKTFMTMTGTKSTKS